MTITSKVIADSISDDCPRLTTMQLRYPRFIHAEFMTHRVFSRNASSSRAIPIDSVIKDIENDPASPILWGANQSGMQSGDEIIEPNKQLAKNLWEVFRDQSLINARKLAKTGLHKQHVNRLLEPFQHINVLVTATEWENFFALRDHDDAQPEIKSLAKSMRDSMYCSSPKKIVLGDWHMPYVSSDDLNDGYEYAKKLSAARCASVSYQTVEGKPMTQLRALKVFNSLTGNPLHASPFEHIARPDPSNGSGCRNFTGWHQWRSDIEMEGKNK